MIDELLLSKSVAESIKTQNDLQSVLIDSATDHSMCHHVAFGSGTVHAFCPVTRMVGVYVRTCGLILSPAAESNIKEMVGCGLLPRLVKLLGASEKGLRAHAVMCLAAGLSSCKCWKESRGDTGVRMYMNMNECIIQIHSVYANGVCTCVLSAVFVSL